MANKDYAAAINPIRRQRRDLMRAAGIRTGRQWRLLRKRLRRAARQKGETAA